MKQGQTCFLLIRQPVAPHRRLWLQAGEQKPQIPARLHAGKHAVCKQNHCHPCPPHWARENDWGSVSALRISRGYDHTRIFALIVVTLKAGTSPGLLLDSNTQMSCIHDLFHFEKMLIPKESFDRIFLPSACIAEPVNGNARSVATSLRGGKRFAWRKLLWYRQNLRPTCPTVIACSVRVSHVLEMAAIKRRLGRRMEC